MKILLKYSFIILALLLTQQCRKDNIHTTNESNQLTDATNVSFLIQITDQDNKTLPNANLQLKGDQNIYTADENGIVYLSKISVSKIGRKATITLDGYFDQIKMLDGISNSKNTKHIQLVKIVSNNNFLIHTGEEGIIHGGGLLKLPSTLQLADGTNYTGQVNVKSVYFNPDDKDFLLAAPGNMTAKDDENSIIILASLGMYNIELYSKDNDELHIPEEEKAIISFPITPTHQGKIPNSIPLWSLDEDQGIWLQEGEAMVSGDKMIAEVSHFSFWNCDLPYRFVDVCITFMNNDQEVIPGLDVSFFLDNNLQFGHETTNSEGKICAKFPINKIISIQLFFSGQVFNIQDIGPFSNFESDYVITIDYPISSVMGNTIDCNMEPVSSGYGVSIYNTDGYHLHHIDQQGYFKYFTLKIAHDLLLVNNEDNKSILIPISNEDLEQDFDLGTQSLCGLEIKNTISGQVMFDDNEDDIPDSPIANIEVEVMLENGTRTTTMTDSDGNYSFDLAPQKCFILIPLQSGKKAIAAGDFSPEDGDDTGAYSSRTIIKCTLDFEEHDADNNFLLVNDGFGSFSGNVMIDLNYDGIGDKTAQNFELYYSTKNNYNNGGFFNTDHNGHFNLDNVPNLHGYLKHNKSDTYSVGFTSDYDHSPDPDGDDQLQGGNGKIPIRLKIDEHDEDNNFVFTINDSWVVVTLMVDFDNDNIGDYRIYSDEDIAIYERDNEGNPTGPELYKTLDGIIGEHSSIKFKNLTPGEYVIEFNENSDYEVTYVEDEIPDNNPPYDIAKPNLIPIDIINKEYDDGILILVKKK